MTSFPQGLRQAFGQRLITLGVATPYKAIESGPAMIQAYGAAEIAIGFFTAWMAATLSVFWMVQWLQTRPLAVFGWWRLAAAGAVVCLAWIGRL